MNKKGLSYEAVMKIPDLIFLVIAFLVVWLLLGLHVKSEVETFPIESDITAVRMLYNSLAYQDPDTGRIYPGVIDLEKLNNKYLETVYSTSGLPLKVMFNDLEAYIDEDNYKDNYAARFTKNVETKTIKLYTLARANQQTQKGEMQIIITKRT